MKAPVMTTARNEAPGTTGGILLACGIASSLLYAVMNVVAARMYEGYSLMSHAISELSAIGAPSRPIWVALGVVYGALVIAFGVGVWRAAGRGRALRVVGGLLIGLGAIGFVWPPMHPRGQGFTLTDVMHIAVTMVAVLLMLLAMVFGSGALGRRFRLYSYASLALFVGFGVLIGMDGPRIAANLPTPWAGLTERINTGVFMLWVVVLATVLLRRHPEAARRGGGVRRLAAHRDAASVARVVDPSTKVVGFWSAVLATLFSLTYVIGQIAEWLGWLGSAGGPESASTPLGIVVLLTPSLFLGPSFLVLMVSTHQAAAPDRRVWSHSAVAFATVYCALIAINYFVQLTWVGPRLAAGRTPGVEPFLFVPFDSFLYAVDLLGYAFMSLATLFAAGVFTGGGLERIARALLVANGLLLPFITLQMFVHELIWIAALWAVTFPASTWALAVLFRRTALAGRPSSRRSRPVTHRGLHHRMASSIQP